MGWSIGYDDKWKRDIGYGVPAFCDHPGCTAVIDRGLGYVCTNQQPYGGKHGCGRFYCSEHGRYGHCRHADDGHLSSEHPDWVRWKLTDESWQQWRDENPEEVAKYQAALAQPGA